MSEGVTMEQSGVVGTADGKRDAAEKMLLDVLRLMDLSLKVETKDGEDGSIAVALYPDGEVPGFSAGKRSPVMEALQFLVNKVVNPPSGPRRWVTLGVGGFPPLRAAVPPPPLRPAAAPTAASPSAAAVTAPAADEATLEVAPDPAVSGLGATLAERSARLGRCYAVLTLSPQDRARMLQASKGLAGVTVSAEGEGRNRRLVFRPERPAPAPRALHDDEEDT